MASSSAHNKKSNMHIDSHQDTLPRVLLIDDQEIAAEMIQHMLEDQPDISFQHVWDARAALSTALAFAPTIVLVDLSMPLIDGYTVIKQFRDSSEFPKLPMVLLSTEDQPERKARGFAMGCDDYLIKWPSKLELIARIRYHTQLISRNNSVMLPLSPCKAASRLYSPKLSNYSKARRPCIRPRRWKP